MTSTQPYVVVLAATTGRVGRSTLAANLAVYLKGLDEDLPVAIVSFDHGFDPALTFALPGNPVAANTELFTTQGIEELLGFGQFGVEYLASGVLPNFSAEQLRALLRESNYPGILILDAGPPGEASASAALQAADLVLAPLRDASDLPLLANARRDLNQGGGHDQMLWLIPSMMEDSSAQGRTLEFLRFAAQERGCQILDSEFLLEPELPRLTQGIGGSILTRMSGSSAHGLLHRLAQLVLEQYRLGADNACQLRRLEMDAALPPRAHRVDLVCPLCSKLACFDMAHYCESLPSRRRWLLHEPCLDKLLEGRKLKELMSPEQAVVISLGIEAANLLPQLKLFLTGVADSYVESELFQPAAESDWQTLIKQATGRTLAEQSPATIMIYPVISGRRVLTLDWYRRCVRLRKQIRTLLAAE